MSFFNNTNRSVQTSVVESGFRPEMFTVANGSYVSNASYGSGVAAANSYSSIQIARGSTAIPLAGGALVSSCEGCNIRVEGNEVDFVCNVVLNAATDPAFGTEEVRIKAMTPVTGLRRNYTSFPLASTKFPSPVFEDVQIVSKLNAAVAPDTNAAADDLKIKARLLHDGSLALVLDNQTTPAVRGLQHNDFNAGFGANAVIFVTVRGRYITE